jgi:hypothetical protein
LRRVPVHAGPAAAQEILQPIHVVGRGRRGVPCEFTRNSRAVRRGVEVSIKSARIAPKRWQRPAQASLPALNKTNTL